MDGETKIISGKLHQDKFRHAIAETDTVYLPEGTSFFTARSGQIVHQIYGVETDRPFDIKRLKIRSRPWSAMRVINDVFYDGERVPMIHQCFQEFDEPVAGIMTH